jgi:hypothetical protein
VRCDPHAEGVEVNADERGRILAFMRDDFRVLRHRLMVRGLAVDDASAVAAVFRRLEFHLEELAAANKPCTCAGSWVPTCLVHGFRSGS